jgi:hypothetical protein
MPAMKSLYYDDAVEPPIPHSIFLAGPTARGVRTAWRVDVLAMLEARGFEGTVILPEFRDGTFAKMVPERFGAPPSPVPGMRATSFNILAWETTGIEHATVVLFWMPFAIGPESSPDSLPGFTTRAEVSREIARDPTRIVLGMPSSAVSGGHIRYHAFRAGVPIAASLAETVDAALARICRE